MILHLLHPEKFAKHIVEIFEEALPGQNKYVIMGDDWGPFQESKVYIDKLGNKVSYASAFYSGSETLDKSNIDKVIVHYLDVDKIRFIRQFGLSDKKIVWAMWGGDIYNQLLYPSGYKMFASWPGPVFANPSRLRWWLKYRTPLNRFAPKDPTIKIVLDFIKESDVTMIGHRSDYEIVKKWFPKEFAGVSHKEFFYLSIEKVLPKDMLGKWSEGHYAFVGHSASPTGNHLVSLKKLNGINLRDRKMILPISYGAQKAIIKAQALKYCGDSCIFLEDYLPLKEYNKLMLQADRFVFCNYRQEALGNIYVALYLGAKVFVSKRYNPRKDFDRFGLIYGITEKINQHNFDEDLTLSQKEHNRRILMDLRGKERQLTLIQAICQ